MPARRRTRLVRAAGLALVAALVAACAPGDAPRTEVGGTFELSVDGRDRSYLLEPALAVPAGKAPALIVVLHQEGGSPQEIAAETALQDLRRSGAALAYPAGLDKSWDAGKCCGTPSRQHVDDVRLVDAVFADASRRAGTDRGREALVGYSSGGMLTYRYVCSRPGRLAAAVIVSGSLESSCDNGITLPDVLTVHGKKDGTIGLTRPIFITRLGLAPRPAASTLGILTSSAGCAAGVTRQAVDAEIRTWRGCRGGTVEALLVREGGHGWTHLEASRRTLPFLRQRLLAGES